MEGSVKRIGFPDIIFGGQHRFGKKIRQIARLCIRLSFEFGEKTSRAANDRRRNPGELCDCDAVALGCRTLFDFVFENDPCAPLSSRNVHIGHFAQLLRESRELKVVCRKERKASRLLNQFLSDGCSERQAVKRRGAAADFVHQDE